MTPEEAYRQAYEAIINGIEMRPVYEPAGDLSMPVSKALYRGRADGIKFLQEHYRRTK